MRSDTAAIVATTVVLLLGSCSGDSGDDVEATAETATVAGPMTPKEVYELNNTATVHVLTASGGGSGFVIDAAEGIVVTNAHVSGGRGPLAVVSSEGDRVPARRLGVAPCEDLAVLKLNTVPDGLTEVTMGDSDQLETQDEVTAIGYPASLDVDTSQTDQQAVTSSGRVQVPKLDADAGSSMPLYVDAIQHDGVVNPGNSGGPLFNDRGELVGINSLSNSSTPRVEGQYYAISSNHARPLIEQLRRGETYSDIGIEGINLQEIPDQTAARLWPNGGLPSAFAKAQVPAFAVLSVEAGSAADQAAIFPYDVITSVGGQPVSSFAQICSVLASTNPGDIIPVTGVYMEAVGQSAVYDEWEVQLRLQEASSAAGGEVPDPGTVPGSDPSIDD